MGASTARNDSKRNTFRYGNAHRAIVVVLVVCVVVDIVGREVTWPRNSKGVACRDRRRGSATPAAANLSLGIAAGRVLVCSRFRAGRRAKAFKVTLIKPVLLDPLGGLVFVLEGAGIALRTTPP